MTAFDLKDALDDLLAGKEVRTPVTLPVGCPIPAERAVVKTGKATYHRDVLPILQNRCQECHRPGEIGPMPLLSYGGSSVLTTLLAIGLLQSVYAQARIASALKNRVLRF